MVEIIYKNHSEVADLADKTLTEVREQLKEDFGIPYKAKATLNGKTVERRLESQTRLNDDDRISFTSASRKGILLIGALLLALIITGVQYAYGFIGDNTILNVTSAGTDFVTVTANVSSSPQWTAYGYITAGSTGGGTLFDIDTTIANYVGDMIATITLANVTDMVEVYRYLALSIEIRDSSNNLVDINNDGEADINDFSLLTLNNAVIAMHFSQSTADIYTVKLRNGTYRSNPTGGGWSSDAHIPVLHCEVSQR